MVEGRNEKNMRNWDGVFPAFEERRLAGSRLRAIIPPPPSGVKIQCHLSEPSRSYPAYSASLTCSIHSTVLPSSFSWMAMWVMGEFGPAPCQCFSWGGNQMTSPT